MRSGRKRTYLSSRSRDPTPRRRHTLSALPKPRRRLPVDCVYMLFGVRYVSALVLVTRGRWASSSGKASAGGLERETRPAGTAPAPSMNGGTGVLPGARPPPFGERAAPPRVATLLPRPSSLGGAPNRITAPPAAAPPPYKHRWAGAAAPQERAAPSGGGGGARERVEGGGPSSAHRRAGRPPRRREPPPRAGAAARRHRRGRPSVTERRQDAVEL